MFFLLYGGIALKLLVGFVCLLTYLNLSGKRQLAQMNSVQLIGNFVLGGIIGGVIYSPQISAMELLIVLLIWSVLMLIVDYAKDSNPLARRFIVGQSIQIIRHGEVLQENMKRVRLDMMGLVTMLRMNKVRSLREVDMAQIEPNGQLTLTKKGEPGIGYVVILNGQPYQNGLDIIGKDQNWLMEELVKQDIADCKTVFGAEWSSQGGLYVVLADNEAAPEQGFLKPGLHALQVGGAALRDAPRRWRFWRKI